ncbi:MAG: HAMP domain-containing sensor histidine kinase [Candidatus Thorarchaeota archaeon]
MKKAIAPVILVSIAIILTIIYNITFVQRESGIDTLFFYAFLAVITFSLVIFFQRFLDTPKIHYPFSLGWGMVFIAAVEKFNAEYLNTQVIENENVFTAMIAIGFGISVIGFYFWMVQSRQQDQVRDQQHKMIELYTSLMTHDAGNDLQAILGYIEAALMIPEGCSKRTIELLEAAQASALRMTSLVKAFKPEVSGVENRLLSIIEMSSLQAEKAHIGLTINIAASDDTKDIEVVGGSMLQMAFANLFRNSAEYAGDKPKISINVSKEEGNVIITLSDSGPGISDEIKRHLFVRGGSGDGHGFGLYLTRQIVAACEGTIELLDSDVGAIFRIVLPL